MNWTLSKISNKKKILTKKIIIFISLNKYNKNEE